MRETLRRQIAITESRSSQLEWHRPLLNGLFPLTIEFGEGSERRLAMFLLRKKHVSVKSNQCPGLNLSVMNMKISYNG